MAKFAAKDSNKNITLSPHGTGKVVVGTGAADATVQSDGNHNLVLQTGNSTTGSISITDGANGDIAISPNGTGTVVVNTDLDVDNININSNSITATNTDGNVFLTPNGTGVISVGTGSAAGALQSNGDHNLVLQTGNSTTGSITITDGANGSIAITPNGTGEVDISKVDIDGGSIDGTTIATSDITVGSSKTLNVSAGTLTTSTAQKEAIVQAGPGSGTLDVSSGTLTTSTAQKQAIVQAGPGSGTLDVSSGTLTTSTAQKDAIVDGSTAISRSGNNLTFAGTVGNTGNNTITSGNLVIGTAGNGIDFSANSGSASGSSSALLDDYEEGSWTPTMGGNPISATGTYIKIGGFVYIKADLTNNTGVSHSIIGGLPFNTASPHATWQAGYATTSTVTGGYMDNGAATFNSVVDGGNATASLANAARILMTGWYSTI
jgi:LEA14-like dessication related protein